MNDATKRLFSLVQTEQRSDAEKLKDEILRQKNEGYRLMLGLGKPRLVSDD